MRTYASTKRILVTGGAGFLGSHLCERLLKEGIEYFKNVIREEIK